MHYKDTFLSFCDQLEIDSNRQRIGLDFLAKQTSHYEPLAKHSINTGILSSIFAEYACLSPKIAFISGLWHDIGKLESPVSILRKTEEFTPEDMEIIKEHVWKGYEILNALGFEFEAWIALTHHTHQKNKYPLNLPPIPRKFSKGAHMDLELYCPIISIADQLDALKRKNLRSTKTKSKSARDLLIENMPSLSEPIKRYCSPEIIEFHESLVNSA